MYGCDVDVLRLIDDEKGHCVVPSADSIHSRRPAGRVRGKRGMCHQRCHQVIRLVDGRTDGFAYWIANIQYLGKVRGNDFM